MVDHLVRKIKWLEKRMLNLEYECYSKAMKDVPSDADVSSEDDVAEEVFSVSISEDEAPPKRSNPSSSKPAPIRSTPTTSKAADAVKHEDMDDQPIQCSEMLQVPSTSNASHALKRPRGRPPKIGRTSGSTAVAAPKRPKGRPPSSKKTVGHHP